MTDVVVFDLAGVLCDFAPAARLAQLATETGLHPGEIEQAIWTSRLDERAESGEFSLEENVEAILRALGRRIDASALLRAWSLAFVPACPVLEVVERTTRPRAVFTNNGPLLKEVLDDEIVKVVDRVIYSFELGARKPEPVAFERLAVELDVVPNEITLIDDDAANCHSARDVGIRAIQFVGAEALATSLSNLDLLVR